MASTGSRYPTLPSELDHPALEKRILELWESEQTFERRRESNRGAEPWSFVDGPITANNSMGVHHAWGRSLKDLYQRFRAAQGYDLRYQNGFDCQGLWVEVEVEKELGLNSKREIEAYGLDRFAGACRDRVATYSKLQSEQSKRLGQWMDWDRSYYTMTDPNIEYIWHFLKVCHESGWLYRGHRPMVWCARCGTSLSQHEVTATDSYRDLEHPSLYGEFPLADVDDGERLIVWTTTPWTLPANVGAAVKPDATYAAVRTERGLAWVMAARVDDVFGTGTAVERTATGSELVGRPYHAPFEELEAQAGIGHRVLAWDDVGTDEGTGIVHIAPGCGAEDFDLGRREAIDVLIPVDEAGLFYPRYGFLTGRSTHDARVLVTEALHDRGLLFRGETLLHRYPVCWRCGTELIFRVADEWFISVEGIRERMITAAATVEWTPESLGKRMEDWLRNMGDWCISRKRYWGLPLPFYETEAGELTVIGSVAELHERAVEPFDDLQELHRPWIDGIRIRSDSGEVARRVAEVGDAWLDAGIVPFSTLGYLRETAEPGGYAKGAGEGLTAADLPDHAYWERWFPADWISEMREQIRLWFYSQLFMSVVLVDRAPYRRVLGYEKLLDETGRPMHKSWGNAIWFDDAVEEMGADVMRFLFAGQSPSQNLKFGYGPANEVKRELLTLWNSLGFFVRYAAIDGFEPRWAEADAGPRTATPLDRWLVARVQALVAETTDALGRYWSPAYVRSIQSFVDDLSNWYIRASRQRFWRSEDDDDKQAAFSSLWYALVALARVAAPVMPFLAEEVWQTIVRPVCADAPDSVHLAPWPAVVEEASDPALLAAIADVRAVLALGRAARAQGGAKLRQPLASVVVAAHEPERLDHIRAHADEIAAELNVKSVTVVRSVEDVVTTELVPNFRTLGRRIGGAVQDVKRLLAEGSYTRSGSNVRVGDWELAEDEFDERSTALDGFEVAAERPFVVAIDHRLTPDLVDEGIARDLIRGVQTLRKSAGFDVTDRILLTWAGNRAAARVLASYGDRLASEVLAVDVVDGAAGDGDELKSGDAELRVVLTRA